MLKWEWNDILASVFGKSTMAVEALQGFVEFDDEGMPKAGSVETLEVRSIQPHPPFSHSINVRSTPEANKRAR